MDKGKQHAAPPTCPITNILTQDIQIPHHSNFPNYMHGYYMPHAWLPPSFVPPPSANPYPSYNQMMPGYPMYCGPNSPKWPSSADSRVVEEVNEPTLERREDEGTFEDDESLGNTNETKNDNSPEMTPQIVHVDDCRSEGVEEPRRGMEFNSLDELNSYYKQYAKQSGFGITTQRSEKGEDGLVRYITIGCAKYGKTRNNGLNVAKPRPSGKTNCKAKIHALKVEGRFRLTTVHTTHNHGLSPHKSRFFRCNREVNESVKRALDINDIAGIRVHKSFDSFAVEAGGYENLTCTEKDCRNYIDKSRELRLGKGGAEALCEYFGRMQYKNDGFFSKMDFDSDGRLRNIFWADGRSRAAYKYFGDVITFDTTYLTNEFDMPFAPFVGVNHHGQSILLGAALMCSEDAETFIWVFQTWLQCMDDIPPKAIITDQDRAMKKAIAIVFPDTRHRFCLWHILRKIPDKLPSKMPNREAVKAQLMKCAYDTQTEDEFEKEWEVLMTMPGVDKNKWLPLLYIDRFFWVPALLKDCFWAGMSTTQRSESMNAFFDGYVNAKTTLKQFVDKFDMALRKKIEIETAADFHSFNVTIPLISTSPLEQRFQALYTNSKFREVQQEIIGNFNCIISLSQKDGVTALYHVEDEVRVDEFIKKVSYVVEYNEVHVDVKCSCALFETRGILCRHVLAIFKDNRVRAIPEKYILDRWRKDIKRRYSMIKSCHDVPEGRPEAKRYSRLLNICHDVITDAASCNEHTEDMAHKLLEMKAIYCTNKPVYNLGFHVELKDVQAGTQNIGSSQQVLDPKVVRGKGRPPSLRKVSRMEKLTTTAKKKATSSKAKQRKLTELENLDLETSRQIGHTIVYASQESMQFEMDGGVGTQADGDIRSQPISWNEYLS